MSVVPIVYSKMDHTFYVDYVDFFAVKCYIYNKKEENIYVKLSNCKI